MELKITRAKIYALNNALQSLDRVDNQTGEKKDKVSFSTNVTYALYKNLTKTKKAVEDYEKIRTAIVRKYLKEGETSLGQAEGEKATKEWDEFYNAEDTIEVFKVKFTDLQVEKNKIQLSALADLEPLIVADDDLESQLYAEERKTTGEVAE